MNKYQESLDRVKKEHIFIEDYLKGEIDLLQELVDKETPENPIETKYTNKCPRCKNQLPLKENALKKKTPKLYCDRCGQRIDWSKVGYK